MSGDYQLEDSIYILFTTRAFATGIPGVLSAATVAVYEDVTATPIETSIAVTETLNSINGLNAVTIAALAASGYNAGGHYHVVIEAGQVDSVSVVGEVVGNFSIQASPVNWAKVTAPTTAVDLSATDIQLVDTATALTNVINSSSVVASVSGNVDGSVGSNVELGPAEVNTEVDNSMVTYGLDHLISASVTGTDVADNSIIADLVSKSATSDYDDFVNTTDSLQAVRDHIADGTNLTEAGGTGDQLTAINLPNQTMDITGDLSGSVGSVTGAVGSVAGNVDGNVTGSVGSNLELGPAEVNTEVADVIKTDTKAELTGVPAANASLEDKVNWMFILARNKGTQTSTTKTLLADDTTTSIATSTISDDGTTFSRNEWS